MGLMDVLQGMANGPRGGAQTAQPGRSGISPLAMGLLAMLAYKTMKGEGPLGGLFGNRTAQGTAPQPTGSGGGLMSWLESGLGGAMTGGAAGGVVSGGLGELLNRLQRNGLGDAGRSWVGNGPNQPVSANDIQKVAGSDTIDALANEVGMSREQLLQRLSAELPQSVDKLTPQGRVPTPEEASQSV
jgi:uncharacterized protein YidB (DUF937 family)